MMFSLAIQGVKQKQRPLIQLFIEPSINHDTFKPLPASPLQGRSEPVSPPVKGEPEGV
jgi:hypothetical protein